MEIETEQFKRPLPAQNKYRFFFTGSSQMLTGIDIDLNMEYNPAQCKSYLKSHLRKYIPNSNQYDLLVYLPGGIPFLDGTLQSIYNSKNGPKVLPYIYGVLIRPVPEDNLNKNFPELCTIKDPLLKPLLSPLCDSSKAGMIDICCLLGYLNHDGLLGDRLLKMLAALIPFPPLLTCMNRVIERNGVTGRDVATITSSLHTFFYSILSPKPPVEKVFEFAFQCCNVITSVHDIGDSFPMQCVEVKEGSDIVEFLKELNQPKIVYFWKGDSGEDANHYRLKKFDMKEVNNENNKRFASFTPIAPLSIRVVTGCSIVRGKEHNFLYVSKTMIKGAAKQNNVDIIDPTQGVATSVDLEEFAKSQGDERVDDPSSLIDPEKVKQVIFVCFDSSGSMNWPLGGQSEKKNKTQETQTRAIIATQYLTSFANKTYGYRVPCIQGLIAFSGNLKIKCPLNPLVPDFEEKGLKQINPRGNTHLWDALSLACDEIVKFTTFSDGSSRFINAKKRILVISDGDDVGSSTSLIDVTKKLLENKIMVDSVIVSTEEKCKPLVTLCHITGGLSFNPSSPNEGLLLFDKSAFLNVEERIENMNPVIQKDMKTRPKNIKPDMITEDFMNKAISMADFDTKVDNKILQRAVKEARLAEPKYICYVNQNEVIKQPRRRRILRELHYSALVMDKSSDRYDEEIVVLPFGSSLDIWQVFIKGTKGSYYEGKWFFLNVTFPDLYPNEPPVFRFISIPYHLNVSSEGRICLDIIERGYISHTHVIDIIQQIKVLFIQPCIYTPIQIGILETYMEDKKHHEYNRLARQSAQEVGKDDYHEFLPERVKIANEVDNSFKLTFDRANVPPYMISQISGRVIKDPVNSSTGVIYEREELKQLILSNRNPICVITGKPLTERIEDLDPI